MTGKLAPWKSAFLGLVVLICLAAAGSALLGIGNFGLWSRQHTLIIHAPDAQSIRPGSHVQMAGLNIGQVQDVAFASDHPGVTITLKIDEEAYRRLHGDATARVLSSGLLGTSQLALLPGNSTAGPYQDQPLQLRSAGGVTEVTDRLTVVAERVDTMLAKIQDGKGTLPKLLNDEEIYNDLKVITSDSRKLVKNLDSAVADLRTDTRKTLAKVDEGVDTIKSDLGEMKQFVRNGNEAVTAIRQDAEAIKSMPIVRSYVEDAAKLMVQPNFDRHRVLYNPDALFAHNSSVLSEEGHRHLTEVANWLNSNKIKKSNVVVCVFVDPESKEHTPAGAKALSKMQAEAIVKFLKDKKVDDISFWRGREITPLGMGMDLSPVVEPAGSSVSPTRVEVLFFQPK